MVILLESIELQQIKLIPKLEGVINLLTLRNETTNETIEYVVTSYQNSFYLLIENVFVLKQENFYELKAFSDGEVIANDRIFCTNQNIEDFSVNNGEYIIPNSNIVFYE
jgi:hypothetical protein